MTESQDQGSFLTGFALGVFAGAAGYFLFGTDRGHKVRRDLQREWENAKQDLLTRTEPESAEVAMLNLRDALYKVAGWLGEFQPSEVKSAKKTAKPKTKQAKTKFKGV